MDPQADSVGAIPGWVLLSPEAVPEAWRSRAIPMMLVPLAPAESTTLLSETPVEQDVAAADLPLMNLLARGHSAAEIARALGYSPRTVNRRFTRLRERFEVSTTQELATELARRGF